MGSDTAPAWPALDYGAWRDTAETLQLWTQIAGKVRLALTPWLNHSWHVPLYVTARGFGTSPIPFDGELLEIDFDLVAHALSLRTSRGDTRVFPLRPQSVAAFHRAVMAALAELGVAVRIDDMPSEVPDPIRFAEDEVHVSYDPAAAHVFWRALVQVDRVFKLFRTGFIGKASPVHLFWGSFDLAVTRFSGRPAPMHPGGAPGLADAVTREAYSHEVSSAGFWPGSPSFPQAAFYSYAYPEPPGYRDRLVGPDGARFDTGLGEFVLPYDAVRAAPSPDAALLEFLQTTYEAAADCGKWDRAALEAPLGRPGIPRPVG
jgi:hypothetical protein